MPRPQCVKHIIQMSSICNNKPLISYIFTFRCERIKIYLIIQFVLLCTKSAVSGMIYQTITGTSINCSNETYSIKQNKQSKMLTHIKLKILTMEMKLLRIVAIMLPIWSPLTQWRFCQVLQHTKESGKNWQWTRKKLLWEGTRDWKKFHPLICINKH